MFLSCAKMLNSVLVVRSRAKSQHTYFKSQCSQYTFVGSCEGATYLFWVAQNASYLFWFAESRANISLARSGNLPIKSRNGRNIRFWVAQSRVKFSVAQSHNTPILSRNGRNIPF